MPQAEPLNAVELRLEPVRPLFTRVAAPQLPRDEARRRVVEVAPCVAPGVLVDAVALEIAADVGDVLGTDRIAGGKLHRIKYIAAYQTRPVSAVTHYAPIASIEPYGEEGKYQLIFAGPAQTITPIPFADAPQGFMQGPRYTTLSKLLEAKKVTDLF